MQNQMSSDFQSVIDSLMNIQPRTKRLSIDDLPSLHLSTMGNDNPYSPVSPMKPNAVSGKGGKVDAGVNLWDVLTGTLGQFGGIVTDSMYDQLASLKDPKKSTSEKLYDVLIGNSFGATMLEGLKAGGKKQVENWTDDKLSWGDVPLVGVLNGADKNYKRGTDIAQDHIGIDNRWGKVGTGIGIDIAFDPLTYLTGGISAATKLKKAAEVAKMAELGKDLGLTGKFKNTEEFKLAAEQAIRTKYAQYPNLVDKMVNKKLGDITEQLKTAGNTVFNQNVNKWGFGVPFTNKMTLADRSKNSLLYRTESTLGSEFKHVADDLLNSATMNNADLKATILKAIKVRYGTDELADLTKTQFDDLVRQMTPMFKSIDSLPDSVIKWSADFGGTPNLTDNIDDLIKGMDGKPRGKNPFTDPTADVKVPKVTSPRLPKDAEVQWDNTADIFKHGTPETQAGKFTRNTGKTMDNLLDTPFNEMMNGHTKLGHLLRSKNPFDARTLATGNKFVDSMGEHIADAHSQKVGETAMFTKSLEDVEKFIKTNNITDDDMRHAIYVLENHAPKHLGKGWTPSTKAKQLADKLRPILDEVAANEKGSVLDNLRKNYFPHVFNVSDEKMKVIQDFANRHPEFKGLSGSSGFSKSRTSFQTIAERDNYLHKLEKAIQSETDVDKIELLRNHQEEVANMFDTNVVSALQRRIREGVRAKSMKAMQGELSKFGMMKTIKKGSKEVPPTNLTRIEPEVAKKLGLGDGAHYVHPDVLEGMKRVDELFTNQGMNKAVRHLNAASDIWRSLVTHYKPAHYVNNILGNIMTNMAAGVKVSDYKAASKLIMGYRKGTLTPEQMKLMKSAYSNNVVSGGFLTDAHHGFEFNVKNSTEKLAEKVIDNKGIKKVRATGEVYDDVTRLANYINGLNKFGNSKRAAQQVREYLFNYNELTNADRHMRTIVPFWNWMKRNIPLQMKLLLENPKFAMNVERFKNLMNDEQEGADWQKETGVKIGNRYVGLPSPTHDLNTIREPLSALGSMNPFAKMMIETQMNKSMFTGNPITYGQDNVAPEDFVGYLAKNFGIVGNAYNMAFNEDTSFLEELANLFKSSTKIRE